MSQLVKEITDTEHRLNDINDTMVAIREKELLLNRYQTSIDEIKKYIDNLNNEIEELSDDKYSKGVATGTLTQLQEQFSDAEVVKQNYREEIKLIQADKLK